MKRNIILTILIICFASIAAFSAWQLWLIFSEYKAGTDVYDDLEQYVTATTPAPDQEDEVPDDTVWPEVDFAALQAINDDVVGWIYLEGTKINYPIVRGSDNDYYLTHLYDGTGNGSGSIFMDYRAAADFSSPNTPIYGHRMNNGSMFAQVANYSNLQFFNEHPTILILTPEKNYKMQVFSAYVAADSAASWDYEFANDEAFADWLQTAKSKSYFDNDVIPEVTEKVVTLSTCTYEFDNARFIVHGVLR